MSEIVGDTHKIESSMSNESDLSEMMQGAVIDSVKEGLEETKDVLIRQLEKKEFFDALIESLNENIDIPMINEKTEKKIFEAIVNCCVSALKKVDFTKSDS